MRTENSYAAYVQAWRTLFGDDLAAEVVSDIDGSYNHSVVVLMDEQTFDLFGLNPLEASLVVAGLRQATQEPLPFS